MDQKLIEENLRVRSGLTHKDLKPIFKDIDWLITQRYAVSSDTLNALLGWIPTNRKETFATFVLGFGLGTLPEKLGAHGLAARIGGTPKLIDRLLGAGQTGQTRLAHFRCAHQLTKDWSIQQICGNELRELGIPLNVWRAAAESGVARTIPEFCRLTEEDILYLRNVGPDSLAEVKKALERKGLALKAA